MKMGETREKTENIVTDGHIITDGHIMTEDHHYEDDDQYQDDFDTGSVVGELTNHFSLKESDMFTAFSAPAVCMEKPPSAQLKFECLIAKRRAAEDEFKKTISNKTKSHCEESQLKDEQIQAKMEVNPMEVSLTVRTEFNFEKPHLPMTAVVGHNFVQKKNIQQNVNHNQQKVNNVQQESEKFTKTPELPEITTPPVGNPPDLDINQILQQFNINNILQNNFNNVNHFQQTMITVNNSTVNNTIGNNADPFQQQNIGNVGHNMELVKQSRDLMLGNTSLSGASVMNINMNTPVPTLQNPPNEAETVQNSLQKSPFSHGNPTPLSGNSGNNVTPFNNNGSNCNNVFDQTSQMIDQFANLMLNQQPQFSTMSPLIPPFVMNSMINGNSRKNNVNSMTNSINNNGPMNNPLNNIKSMMMGNSGSSVSKNLVSDLVSDFNNAVKNANNINNPVNMTLNGPLVNFSLPTIQETHSFKDNFNGMNDGMNGNNGNILTESLNKLSQQVIGLNQQTPQNQPTGLQNVFSPFGISTTNATERQTSCNSSPQFGSEHGSEVNFLNDPSDSPMFGDLNLMEQKGNPCKCGKLVCLSSFCQTPARSSVNTSVNTSDSGYSGNTDGNGAGCSMMSEPILCENVTFNVSASSRGGGGGASSSSCSFFDRNSCTMSGYGCDNGQCGGMHTDKMKRGANNGFPDQNMRSSDGKNNMRNSSANSNDSSYYSESEWRDYRENQRRTLEREWQKNERNPSTMQWGLTLQQFKDEITRVSMQREDVGKRGPQKCRHHLEGFTWHNFSRAHTHSGIPRTCDNCKCVVGKSCYLCNGCGIKVCYHCRHNERVEFQKEPEPCKHHAAGFEWHTFSRPKTAHGHPRTCDHCSTEIGWECYVCKGCGLKACYHCRHHEKIK